MYMLDRTVARKILISELGYQPQMADFYLDHYPMLDDRWPRRCRRG
jgi:hypothetical protein